MLRQQQRARARARPSRGSPGGEHAGGGKAAEVKHVVERRKEVEEES